MNAAAIAGSAVVLALIGPGLILCWRLAASPAARARTEPSPLLPWVGPPSGIVLLFALALIGAVAGQYLSLWGFRRAPVSGEGRLVLAVMGYEAGMLAGIAGFFLTLPGKGARPPAAPWRTLRDGVVTLLVALPPVWAVSFVWQGLLTLCHLPVKEQDTVSLFLGLNSTVWRVGFALVATVAAPITEELLFRAGLFRYCRGRLPRWLAILGPAVVFGAAHLLQSPLDGLAAFAPLVMLGVVFAFAYERTGHIGTTMVAHGLFNLITIVLVVLGFNA